MYRTPNGAKRTWMSSPPWAAVPLLARWEWQPLHGAGGHAYPLRSSTSHQIPQCPVVKRVHQRTLRGYW